MVVDMIAILINNRVTSGRYICKILTLQDVILKSKVFTHSILLELQLLHLMCFVVILLRTFELREHIVGLVADSPIVVILRLLLQVFLSYQTLIRWALAKDN